MKEACWNDCIETKNSIRIFPDKAKSKNLIETEKGRIEYSKSPINEKTANYIFENYYSSIIELIHSIILSDGYKINNHLCLGFYLKEIAQREDLFILFDDLRYKRNSLVYYGTRMEFEIAKEAIEKSEKLIKELEKLIKNNQK